MSEPIAKYHNGCEKCDELFWCIDGFQTLCGDCAWKELEKCRDGKYALNGIVTYSLRETDVLRAEVEQQKNRGKEILSIAKWYRRRLRFYKDRFHMGKAEYLAQVAIADAACEDANKAEAEVTRLTKLLAKALLAYQRIYY